MSDKNKHDFLLAANEVKVMDIGKRELREHRHSKFEIVHFRKGTGVYSVNGHNYSIKPDDVFVFSSNEQHCITEIIEPLEFVNIHFEPRFFWGSRNESFSDAGMFFYHSDNFKCRLSRSSESTKQIAILIEEILKAMDSTEGEDFVLIHDAARPLLSEQMISECVNAVQGHDGALPVLPMKDTVYLSMDGKKVDDLLDRNQIYAGQAPEIFQIGKYYEANKRLLPKEI